MLTLQYSIAMSDKLIPIMKSIQILIIILCVNEIVFAQTYSDYFGNGNSVGVTTSSSGNDTINTSANTLNGTGYFPNEAGAARFFHQASFGADYSKISALTTTGLENWIDQQIQLPSNSFQEKHDEIYAHTLSILDTATFSSAYLYKNQFLSYTFYETLFKNPDQLRLKTAFALSQIFVVSYISMPLSVESNYVSNYYDVLYEGAFGNVRDLLYKITMHPIMGLYLSHYQNAKSDLTAGVFPDENYAREIMQLFTIGLFELNNDGTHKKDANGNSIPTYDNNDIQELAKVFTGLSGAETKEGDVTIFSQTHHLIDLSKPMLMYEDFHDKAPKVMLDGTVLPGNQPGMDDINYVIDMLFNHPNIAPFLSYRLIQQMVKSNPTPQYVNRVATIFNDNGNGVKGDLASVVKAILLDPEARNCTWINEASAGKLLQPIEKFTILLKAFDVATPSDKFNVYDERYFGKGLEQSFLYAPTVFNFFNPFYAESEFVAPNNLVSPEFQILNSASAIHYLNEMHRAIFDKPFHNRTAAHYAGAGLTANVDDVPFLDFTIAENIYSSLGVSALVDHLNILLCRSQLNASAKSIIENAIVASESQVSNFGATDAVKFAVYFITSTPSFAILK